MKLIQFRNCRLVRNHLIVREDLWVRGGKIIDPMGVFFDEQRHSDVQIDCHGALIAPGFIDLQINGGYGVDFSHDVNSVQEGVSKVARGLLSHGVTSFCPTLVTSPIATYTQVLPKIPRRAGSAEGATILGVHLEGPFINPSKKGAHPEGCIREFSRGFDSLLEVYGDLQNVSIVTIAPEKENAKEVIEELTRRGITVSLGHTMANLKEGELACQHGATLITHLFNAMLPFHHRDPGIVGLLASNRIPPGKTIYYGIIADGIHTHPAALRIAYRVHPEGLILVTDAISAMGLSEGTHHIGQMSVDVSGGRAYVAGTKTLCGSIAPMDECVRIFLESAGCDTVFALEAASLAPAKCLGIAGKKGTLDFGADADFVLLDDKLGVCSTWISGECVYRNPEKVAPIVTES
ncbi:N-acetylglucosamine-6-phosphate deacetylase [Lutzomyia longipalpis]|uniref:N-acetylglucosamine-6-phosphate deacetylase n=1 Tax=Lutzomyia longipalpis TaxID=7200 RepID=UPI0024839FB0|nr:N-acetylglucosamine-6-phosphate deacetylase [Lutzomyia longipalpis]